MERRRKKSSLVECLLLGNAVLLGVGAAVSFFKVVTDFPEAFFVPCTMGILLAAVAMVGAASGAHVQGESDSTSLPVLSQSASWKKVPTFFSLLCLVASIAILIWGFGTKDPSVNSRRDRASVTALRVQSFILESKGHLEKTKEARPVERGNGIQAFALDDGTLKVVYGERGELSSPYLLTQKDGSMKGKTFPLEYLFWTDATGNLSIQCGDETRIYSWTTGDFAIEDPGPDGRLTVFRSDGSYEDYFPDKTVKKFSQQGVQIGVGVWPPRPKGL